MSNSVKLERIQVRKLFERFTYDIDVNNGYNVAILIAPNGCGKTTVFNLVDFIFKPSMAKYRKISNIPFEECICTLSDGRKLGLEIRTEKGRRKKDEMRVTPRYMVGMGLGSLTAQGKAMYFVVEDDEKHQLNLTEALQETAESIMDDDLPFSEGERFIDSIDFDSLSPREISPAVARRISYQSEKGLMKISDFREKYNCRLDINFISADRLHKQIFPRKNMGYYGRKRGYEERENDPLGEIQDNVEQLYSKTDAEYKRLVSEARDKLPKMYLSTKNQATKSLEDFEKEWKEYVSDLEKYYQIGLLESNQTILETNEIKKAFDEYGAFLSVYLDAFKSTLEPWNKEYERLKLFVDILNRRNRVTRKELKYGPKGLVILVDGKPLSLECLSSGEKNDLIMFYNLIFNSEKGGLVLVDEPEISLHIEWQEEYLDCLLDICRMNELQAIVATHSPNIVNGHLELYAKRGLVDEH